MLLQVVKMTDEVTVSSLPHPISMFFLGIFAVTLIVMLIEVINMKKEKTKLVEAFEEVQTSFEDLREELGSKITEVSKKIDSRVDKAVANLKTK
jgi:hypothetical protein